MKNHNNTVSKKLYFILPLAAVLIGFGCKKEPVDYRSRYVGTWDFHVERINYDASAGTESESLTYTGPISYVDTDKLNIRYTSENALELAVDRLGKLSLPSNTSVYCSGHFDEAGKMSLTIRWGSQTLGARHNINGQKH